MTAEARLDAVKRENATRRNEEQRALDALARHLRWHHEAGGRGLTLEELHAKVATTRYGVDATRRRLQELADAGRCHKVVVDQVAVWRHGVEPLPEVPTTADRVLEAVKAWPTWSELEAAVGVQGYDLGEVVTPLEREKRVVRRTTFRAPGQLAWLPADDAAKALSARELAVLLHLEALPASDDIEPFLRGESTLPDGWVPVKATRERLGFPHSTWSYVTGHTALGAELRARTLGGPLLERRTTAQVRLSTWARELLGELRTRGLLLLEASKTAPAAAGADDELEAPPPPVGETPDVAGDGLVQPSPLDPPRVDTVAAGDANHSGREGTDEDGVADGDPAEPHSDPQDPNGVEEPELTLADWPDVDVEDLDGNCAEVSAAPDENSHKSVAEELFDVPPEFIWVRRCVLCGCTDDQACVEADGETPCAWFPASNTTADVCSACVELLVLDAGVGPVSFDALRVEVVGAVEVVRAQVVGIRNDLVEEATRAGREGAQLLAALLATDLGKLGASLAALEQRLGVVDELARRVELLGVQVDRVERHVEELRARPPVAEAVRRFLEVS